MANGDHLNNDTYLVNDDSKHGNGEHDNIDDDMVIAKTANVNIMVRMVPMTTTWSSTAT